MSAPALRLARVSGLACVQDGGRPGWLHQGVPAGGALCRPLMARANAAVGNALGDAVVELFGAVTVVASGAVTTLGLDDGSRVDLADGAALDVICRGRRVAYLAVRGGIDVPVVLGGRGTLLVANLGGLEGRALRSGDVLRAGAAPIVASSPPSEPDLASPLRLIPGPDLDALPVDTLSRLLSTTFVVDPRSDRVGTRLGGLLVPRPPLDLGRSRPMVPGAIQLPPDGVPIVLGPDHPATGGYPVVATLLRADQGRLGAFPIGHPVRLVAQP